KILDNLRRSLLSPALLLLLTIAWLQSPRVALIATILICVVPAISLLTQVTINLIQSIGHSTLRDIVASLEVPVLRWLLLLTFLPYEAYQAADAIVTTLHRMLFTRRHLLRWTTAAHLVRQLGVEVNRQAAWGSMIVALLITAFIGLLVGLTRPQNLLVAAPLFLVWLISPQIAYWISRPLAPPYPPSFL